MRIREYAIPSDLSESVIEDAIRLLELPEKTRWAVSLQVGPEGIISAANIACRIPAIKDVVVCPHIKDLGWAVWWYDNCVWSPGP